MYWSWDLTLMEYDRSPFEDDLDIENGEFHSPLKPPVYKQTHGAWMNLFGSLPPSTTPPSTPTAAVTANPTSIALTMTKCQDPLSMSPVTCVQRSVAQRGESLKPVPKIVAKSAHSLLGTGKPAKTLAGTATPTSGSKTPRQGQQQQQQIQSTTAILPCQRKAESHAKVPSVSSSTPESRKGKVVCDVCWWSMMKSPSTVNHGFVCENRTAPYHLDEYTKDGLKMRTGASDTVSSDDSYAGGSGSGRKPPPNIIVPSSPVTSGIDSQNHGSYWTPTASPFSARLQNGTVAAAELDPGGQESQNLPHEKSAAVGTTVRGNAAESSSHAWRGQASPANWEKEGAYVHRPTLKSGDKPLVHESHGPTSKSGDEGHEALPPREWSNPRGTAGAPTTTEESRQEPDNAGGGGCFDVVRQIQAIPQVLMEALSISAVRPSPSPPSSSRQEQSAVRPLESSRRTRTPRSTAPDSNLVGRSEPSVTDRKRVGGGGGDTVGRDQSSRTTTTIREEQGQRIESGNRLESENATSRVETVQENPGPSSSSSASFGAGLDDGKERQARKIRTAALKETPHLRNVTASYMEDLDDGAFAAVVAGNREWNIWELGGHGETSSQGTLAWRSSPPTPYQRVLGVKVGRKEPKSPRNAAGKRRQETSRPGPTQDVKKEASDNRDSTGFKSRGSPVSNAPRPKTRPLSEFGPKEARVPTPGLKMEQTQPWRVLAESRRHLEQEGGGRVSTENRRGAATERENRTCREVGCASEGLPCYSLAVLRGVSDLSQGGSGAAAEAAGEGEWAFIKELPVGGRDDDGFVRGSPQFGSGNSSYSKRKIDYGSLLNFGLSMGGIAMWTYGAMKPKGR